MTIAELATELSIPYATASALMRSDRFPAFRIGRKYVVHPADFAKWREKHVGCKVSFREKVVKDERRQAYKAKYAPYAIDRRDFFPEVAGVM